ncbi:MAG TPA: multidrug effflux MFS transporter, partial [Flavisolibacter sp.]|nr:multidrug effflux MFS transporter [Flavisolibacter sp.]
QLLYGPLLDRYGRKRPLYIGMMVYILASIGCVFIHSVNSLIGMRFLQAIGGCVSLVASRALVRDLFPVSETAKVFSMLMLVLAVSPMLAPTIGGYVSVAFSWHIIFVILASIAALVLFACLFFLPDGKHADPSISLKPGPILGNFYTVLKQPQFYAYALCGSIASAVTYAYIASSPDVFMDIFKVGERTYGWIFACIAASIIGSSQLNRLMLKWFTSEQLVLAALLWQLLIGTFLILGVTNGWLGLYGLIITVFLFMAGQGFTVPNASALSIAPFSRLAGSASALLGALQLGFGSLISALVSVFNNGTTWPMVLSLTGCSILSLIVLLLCRKKNQKEPATISVEQEAGRQIVEL